MEPGHGSDSEVPSFRLLSVEARSQEEVNGSRGSFPPPCAPSTQPSLAVIPWGNRIPGLRGRALNPGRADLPEGHHGKGKVW